ncbi:MAG: hypothetical protein HQK65_10455 [Desulfamplus sp.]|nr:hypothetical protein [Desulfamplus sp.]
MRLTITISVLLMFASAAWSDQSLEDRVKILEKKVSQLEMILKESSEAKTHKAKVIKKNTNSKLKLTDWSYSYEKGEISDYYEIYYFLSNSYSKSIKLIDGSIQFKDLLGERIYGIKITPDLKIQPGKTVKDGGSFSINQFINSQSRMKEMSKEDIVVELVVRKLVFSDNSILEIKP